MAKAKSDTPKYIRLSLEAKPEERAKIIEGVNKGNYKFAYFAVDGDQGYNYYEIIKQ